MLTENLTEEKLKGLRYSTADLVELFKQLDKKGYSGMNLKLIIDLIGTLEEAE